MRDGTDGQLAAAAPALAGDVEGQPRATDAPGGERCPAIPLTDLRAQHAPIRGELDVAVGRVLDSGTYVLGEEVEAFEAEFAAYCGRALAVATDSGTSALHLALLALGVDDEDEVVTVAHTFVATVAAIRHAGGRPVLVDTAAGSCTMDPLRLEAAITARTRAILPVHLFGQCADMDAINAIAHRHGLAVVEDAAQAHGALYGGRRAGSLGDLACFSFYPAKNLGACGEGGIVVTDDPDLAGTMRMLRDHGQSARYRHELIGFNYRMDALQAAVLRVKLRHLDAWNESRRHHAAEYRRLLAGSIEMLAEMPYGTPVYHQFPVFHDDRDGLRSYLAERGIATGVHYPAPVHLQPAYRDLGYREGDLPQSERSCRRTLSLPFYPEMPASTPARVAELVAEFPRTSRRAGGTRAAPDSLSVCLPAYNEAEIIGDILKETDALLRASGLSYEIIVCDDGSTDGTGAIVEEFARTDGRVRTLRHERNLGIRATFEELYTKARGDVVIVNSVDGQWPMATALGLVPLTSDADIVIAGRRRKFYGWTRAFVSWGYNLLPRLLFGFTTHDAGALKVYRREVLREIPVISRSPFSEAERLIRAGRAGYRITVCPVDIKPRKTGRAHGVSLRTVGLALLDVVRVWWDLHAGTASRRPPAPAPGNGGGR
jgi:dTDP-4-amino-4,6-dideoxygalactose transaminase